MRRTLAEGATQRVNATLPIKSITPLLEMASMCDLILPSHIYGKQIETLRIRIATAYRNASRISNRRDGG